MATRAELVQCCKELDIDSKGMLIDDMKKVVRVEADKKYNNKRYSISADKISETLLKFLVLEYDFKIYDKNGNELNWDYKKGE
jgi:CRISPR/Cas system-associated protein Cas5 (RAMP superfamily)